MLYLLKTIEHLPEKYGGLQIIVRGWFNPPVEKYGRINVKKLRQWIRSTKELFLDNKNI